MDKPNLQGGFEESGSGYTPISPQYSTEETSASSFDFGGALWRRKAVVLLLALLGAGIACLAYTQATPSYSSTIRLMLFVQAPPSVVNGEVIPPLVALEKQRLLLTSQPVLTSAIERGQLDKLPTFAGSESTLTDLRLMLKVTPASKDLTADALDVRCSGGNKEDLQGILNQVVASYIKTLSKDSEAAGQESVELIEKLQQSLVEDQQEAQAKYYAILKELNLSAENEKGKWINPYIAEIDKLRLQRDAALQDFRKSDQLLEEVRVAVDPENKREELLKLAVVEAKKYFNSNGISDLDSQMAEDRQRLVRYEQRIETAMGDVVHLEAEKEEMAKRYGTRHPRVEDVETRYKAALAMKKRLIEEYDSVKSSTLENSEETARKDALNQDLKARDQETLQIYTAALLNQRERAKYTLDKLTEDIAELNEKSTEIAADITEINMLRDQIDERRESVTQILEKLSALRVVSGNYSTTKVKIIDDASEAKQDYPKILIFLGLGLFLGALLGGGLALLIDLSDLSFRTPIDIQESLNVPVICKVPKIRKGKGSKDFPGSPMLITAYSPNSSASETFRAARTSILFSAAQTGGKVFMITSPSPGDGKSTTIANLAVSIAQTNKRVCLVDADLRRPRLPKNFGVQFDTGSMQYLNGEATLDEVLRPCDFQTNLTLLTTGGRPKNPGELVASKGFADMLAELRSRFDFVLIDSPPVIPVADATSLSSVVDGIILVLRIRRGVMLTARKTKERLDMVHANLMGVIVNGVDENSYYNEYGTYYRGAYYGGYNYGKYYEKQYSHYSDRPQTTKQLNRT